ncbi:MAG: hypothetical protein ABII09_06415 [Planctomycetota bacterium]
MNKKLLWIVSVVITFVGTSMAIDFMGPPTAGLKEGQWKIGYTYHHSENDLLVDYSKYYVNGVKYKIDLEDVEIDDIKVTRNYVTFNYGLADDRMEIYGFLGAADTESGTFSGIGEDVKFSGDQDFAFGVGTKVTTNIYDNVDWGILAQASWIRSSDTVQSFSGTYEGHTYSGKYDVEFDAVEIQVAAGPTIKIRKDWKVYGGVVGYWLYGDLEEKISGTVDGTPAGSLKLCGDLKQDSAFGGYIGTQIDLFKNAAIAAEYANTGDSEGFGVNVSWKF